MSGVKLTELICFAAESMRMRLGMKSVFSLKKTHSKQRNSLKVSPPFSLRRHTLNIFSM
jgi:hypothetical protein